MYKWTDEIAAKETACNRSTSVLFSFISHAFLLTFELGNNISFLYLFSKLKEQDKNVLLKSQVKHHN